MGFSNGHVASRLWSILINYSPASAEKLFNSSTLEELSDSARYWNIQVVLRLFRWNAVRRIRAVYNLSYRSYKTGLGN